MCDFWHDSHQFGWIKGLNKRRNWSKCFPIICNTTSFQDVNEKWKVHRVWTEECHFELYPEKYKNKQKTTKKKRKTRVQSRLTLHILSLHIVYADDYLSSTGSLCIAFLCVFFITSEALQSPKLSARHELQHAILSYILKITKKSTIFPLLGQENNLDKKK